MIDAKTLRELAKSLNAQADAIEGGSPSAAASINIFAGSKPSYGPVPAEFQNPKDPYGSRPDIGGPGGQATLRTYALRDGLVDLNTYIKDRGLTPIWPDAKQEWDTK